MWTIDDTYRIYMQDIDEGTTQIIPRLQPVGDKTVLQIFGYESDIYKVKFKVVGYEDHDAIKAMVKDGTTHTITESGIVPSGWVKTAYFASFSSTRDKTLKQTMRQDLDCYAPVFTVDLEIFNDS